jgi:hypothetical protein
VERAEPEGWVGLAKQGKAESVRLKKSWGVRWAYREVRLEEEPVRRMAL